MALGDALSPAYTYSQVPDLIRQELYDTTLIKKLDNWLISRPLFDDKSAIFPDGDTLNVPVTADRTLEDYTENTQIVYSGQEPDRRSLAITEYKSDAFFVTDKMKQDSYVAEAFFAENVDKSGLAMLTAMETDVLKAANDGQTAADPNKFNDAVHRFVAGAGGTRGDLTIQDIQAIKYAFDKAYVPVENRVLIINPETEFKLNSLLNITEVANGSQFNYDIGGLVQEGFGKGLNIQRNIMGINIIVSHNLDAITAESLGYYDESGEADFTGTAAVAMSMASAGDMPMMGAIRQAPQSEFFRNTNFKRDEWSNTCRYGFSLKRPEALVVVGVNDTIAS